MANRAAGAGYESQTNYPSSRIEFFNIGNIHVMRDSLRALMALVLNPSSAQDVSFSKGVEDSQWLTHVRLVIKASWDSAQLLHKGVPVLVHCSHGWDRTAQVWGDCLVESTAYHISMIWRLIYNLILAAVAL